MNALHNLSASINKSLKLLCIVRNVMYPLFVLFSNDKCTVHPLSLVNFDFVP
jgi:hypothetical protein